MNEENVDVVIEIKGGLVVSIFSPTGNTKTALVIDYDLEAVGEDGSTYYDITEG